MLSPRVPENRSKFSRFPENHWSYREWYMLFTRQRFFQSSGVYSIFNNYSTRVRWISNVIIQQIVTMPIYGKEALNICHPT